MHTMTATYSPEDNKLRLYTATRLDKETYTRVRAAGFKRAPKQDLFVAPMWTPQREDLLIELCGEIDDEDTSLADRAEERADRFEGYSEKRAADADSAHAAVRRIADNIPLGQPILVGHHSERHARKDAERIENGMRKAVRMWETSKYWTDRANGAIRHAKYKERPDVRFRRIKGLEADRRKQVKTIERAEGFIKLWSKDGLTREQALLFANHDHVYLLRSDGESGGDYLSSLLDKDAIAPADAAARAIKLHTRTMVHAQRWLAHIDNRLAYERAMLGEGGGIATDKFNIEIGGRVLCRGWRQHKGYLVVLRVNRTGGVITSVRTSEGVISVEKITDYRAPAPEDVEKVKKVMKLPPLVNYPGEGFRHMTKAEYDKSAKHSDFYGVRRVKETAQYGAHRRREAPKEGRSYYDTTGVYLTDVKRVDPPAPASAPAKPVTFEHQPDLPAQSRAARSVPKRTAFDDMREQLASGGVKVVRAEQLFPTPSNLAARMVQLAEIEPTHRVLEPSSGTGAILREIKKTGATAIAIEINRDLAQATGARCADFLACADLGHIDRAVMNPPFAPAGADIDHVQHAFAMLDEGGILVAVMSAGTKFRSDKKTTAFRALVDKYGEIEDLPEDTFIDSGTRVPTVLVILRK